METTSTAEQPSLETQGKENLDKRNDKETIQADNQDASSPQDLQNNDVLHNSQAKGKAEEEKEEEKEIKVEKNHINEQENQEKEPAAVELVNGAEDKEEEKKEEKQEEIIFTDELKPNLEKLCQNCRSVDDYFRVIRIILEDYKYDQVNI